MTEQETIEQVVIVSGVDPTIRACVRVVRLDGRYVYVDHDGVERRFSRASGFEAPEGGSWGSFRLAGKDKRRLKL